MSDFEQNVVELDEIASPVVDTGNTLINSKQRNLFNKDLAKCVIVLVLIAMVSGALLGLMNWLTYVDPELTIMEQISKYYSVSADNVIKAPDRIINDGSKNSVERCYVVKGSENEVLGIVYQAIGSGANKGTLELLVYLSEDGIVKDIEEFSQKESPGYFDDVMNGMRGRYIGVDLKTINSFILGGSGDGQEDVDAISGSTRTSRGFNNAINAVVYAFNNYEEVA